MIRGMDGYVMRLMAGVKTRVYEQPGLLSYKILVGKKARLLRVLGVIYTTDTQCTADVRGGRAVDTVLPLFLTPFQCGRSGPYEPLR